MSNAAFNSRNERHLSLKYHNVLMAACFQFSQSLTEPCCSGSKSSLRCQAAPSAAPLTASASTHFVQDSADDAEGSHDRCSSLPERTSCLTHLHAKDTYCCTSTNDCPQNEILSLPDVHFYPNMTTLRSGICRRNSVCRLSAVCRL